MYAPSFYPEHSGHLTHVFDAHVPQTDAGVEVPYLNNNNDLIDTPLLNHLSSIGDFLAVNRLSLVVFVLFLSIPVRDEVSLLSKTLIMLRSIKEDMSVQSAQGSPGIP